VTKIVSTAVLGDAATGERTGTICEPSFATSGQRMLVTGNWFASRSTDGGVTWNFIDPFTSFPAAAGGLCCDQVVHYSRSRRVWVWVLQYNVRNRTNVFRIAASSSGAPGTWKWWDVAPTDVDPDWNTVWFDYPDIAESDDHLWVSFNLYDRFDEWARAAVFRFPLDDLAGRGELTRRSWSTTDVGSLRFVHGAGDEMWFAGSGPDNDTIELFAWPDDSTQVAKWSIAVEPWNDTGYTSRGPGNAEWLARLDGRITAAWRSGGRLGFAWSAADEPQRPHPFIRVARIEEATLTLVDQPDLWSVSGAYAYPAAAPNRRGRTGMTAFFGGPTHPAHVVAVFDESRAEWQVRSAVTSTHGPTAGKWGDYLTCRPDPRRTTYWVASGYTLQGGRDRRHVEPHLVTFKP
jgi:hypothetical protein